MKLFILFVGFPVDVLDVSYQRYGSRVRDGLRPLSPLRWMMFLSYLRSGSSIAILSLMWRVPLQTFRDIISRTLVQLQLLVDEVRKIFC